MKVAPLSASATSATLRFFSSASDLTFLPAGLTSNTTSCSRIAMARARGGTLASVRSTARSACLPSNCASALALSGLADDLEVQPRIAGLEQGGELGGEPGLRAVGVADREHQCFGIQPDPGAPHRRDRQNHRQRGKKQHLPAVAFDKPRTRERLCWLRRRDFCAHGSYPGRVGAPPLLAPRVARRDRKYLKKNDNSSVVG